MQFAETPSREEFMKFVHESEAEDARRPSTFEEMTEPGEFITESVAEFWQEVEAILDQGKAAHVQFTDSPNQYGVLYRDEDGSFIAAIESSGTSFRPQATTDFRKIRDYVTTFAVYRDNGVTAKDVTDTKLRAGGGWNIWKTH